MAVNVAVNSGVNSGAIDAQRAQQLEHLVRQDCGSCHGMTLKGGLGPDIRAATLQGSDPEAVKQIILDGVPGTPMPPWRALISETEARWIADYLIRGGAQ
ncbi:MAG: cytochrome c [Alphaproteobacteria bacterium]|nr:cytochrome c [Alphaproteobacteria bacterium]